MGKRSMCPLEVDGKEYRCANEAIWPPIEIEVYGPTAEHVRYIVSDVKYQRIKTWEKLCGLRQMEATKCLKCPLVTHEGEPLAKRSAGYPVYAVSLSKNPQNR